MANPTGKNQYTGRASGHAELHKTIKAGTKGGQPEDDRGCLPPCSCQGPGQQPEDVCRDAYRPEDPGVVPNSNRSCQHAEV